mmetsp:Transcript_26574/g.64578  ORF Transcript_26574/g.64578 Transcript_26574/m.64578 type:complete len:316 (-) Transcript_26574:788-1735(-)
MPCSGHAFSIPSMLTTDRVGERALLGEPAGEHSILTVRRSILLPEASFVETFLRLSQRQCASVSPCFSSLPPKKSFWRLAGTCVCLSTASFTCRISPTLRPQACPCPLHPHCASLSPLLPLLLNGAGLHSLLSRLLQLLLEGLLLAQPCSRPLSLRRKRVSRHLLCRKLLHSVQLALHLRLPLLRLGRRRPVRRGLLLPLLLLGGRRLLLNRGAEPLHQVIQHRLPGLAVDHHLGLLAQRPRDLQRLRPGQGLAPYQQVGGGEGVLAGGVVSDQHRHLALASHVGHLHLDRDLAPQHLPHLLPKLPEVLLAKDAL